MSDWKTKVVAEIKVSDNQVWRAQLSKSPEGKKFAGVRQVIVKKDGTEVFGKGGFTFVLDSGTDQHLDTVAKLTKALRVAVRKINSKDK